MEAKESRVGLAIHILLVFIAGIYPLLLFEVDFGSFALQHLILFLCTMGVLLYCVLLIRSGKWEIHFPRTRVNLMVAILAAYSLIRILYKIVITNEENLESFGYEIVVLAMAALYVLIMSRLVFREFYFDILLYSSLVVFALLLIKYFAGMGWMAQLRFCYRISQGLVPTQYLSVWQGYGNTSSVRTSCVLSLPGGAGHWFFCAVCKSEQGKLLDYGGSIYCRTNIAAAYSGIGKKGYDGIFHIFVSAV